MILTFLIDGVQFTRAGIRHTINQPPQAFPNHPLPQFGCGCLGSVDGVT